MDESLQAVSDDRPLVVIARVLLDSGLALLSERCEVRSGGLHATRAQILSLVRGAAAIVSDASVSVDAELLASCGPQLQIVANFAVGYDNVDLGACAGAGVLVTNTPGVLSSATAELAVALTLAAARGIFDAAADLRAGRWRHWDPSAYAGPQVAGSVLGVVGMGRIGTEYARMMKGLAVRQILYASRSAKPEVERELQASQVELAELMSAADIVSLHTPATAETHQLIDAQMLSLMKPSAILINTSRGSVLDELALAAALSEGRIWGAGLDVFEREPSVPDELLSAPRAVLLPHIGSATARARNEMAVLVARNVLSVLDGGEALTPVC